MCTVAAGLDLQGLSSRQGKGRCIGFTWFLRICLWLVRCVSCLCSRWFSFIHSLMLWQLNPCCVGLMVAFVFVVVLLTFVVLGTGMRVSLDAPLGGGASSQSLSGQSVFRFLRHGTTRHGV